MVPVVLPPDRVVGNVATNGLQGAFVANDAIIEPGLPGEIGVPGNPNPFGANRFELPDDPTNVDTTARALVSRPP